ncbi:hypothetical protein V6N12_066579 [Hibiscus sabdariffa]|uniref:Uncharacterized protein n=1 Tax=Hibiscus sabdariffa TaxID=183260 RepID=A0ABR2CQK3_9ROSI
MTNKKDSSGGNGPNLMFFGKGIRDGLNSHICEKVMLLITMYDGNHSTMVIQDEDLGKDIAGEIVGVCSYGYSNKGQDGRKEAPRVVPPNIPGSGGDNKENKLGNPMVEAVSSIAVDQDIVGAVGNDVEFKVQHIFNPFVHGRVRMIGSHLRLNFMAVYAGPDVKKRKLTWRHLNALNSGPNVSWLLG